MTKIVMFFLVASYYLLMVYFQCFICYIAILNFGFIPGYFLTKRHLLCHILAQEISYEPPEVQYAGNCS